MTDAGAPGRVCSSLRIIRRDFVRRHPSACAQYKSEQPPLWRALVSCGGSRCLICHGLLAVRLEVLRRCLAEGLGEAAMRLNVMCRSREGPWQIGLVDVKITVLDILIGSREFDTGISDEHLSLLQDFGMLHPEPLEVNIDNVALFAHGAWGIHDLVMYAAAACAAGVKNYSEFCEGGILPILEELHSGSVLFDVSYTMQTLQNFCMYADGLLVPPGRLAHCTNIIANLAFEWNARVLVARMAPWKLPLPKPAQSRIRDYLLFPESPPARFAKRRSMAVAMPTVDVAVIDVTNAASESAAGPRGCTDNAMARESAAAAQDDMGKGADLLVEAAMAQSMEESNREDAANLLEAIMRSKIDAPVSSDGIVVMRLKRIGLANDVNTALLSSPPLSAVVEHVIQAGCEVCPQWTPAKLLVPLTQEMVSELGIELRAHHIVAREGDKQLIEAALRTLPCRRRPTLSAPPTSEEMQVAGSSSDQMVLDDTAVPQEALEMSALEIVLTFYHIPLPKDVSEASCTVESAPCGDVETKQPRNPRLWKPS